MLSIFMIVLMSLFFFTFPATERSYSEEVNTKKYINSYLMFSFFLTASVFGEYC